MENIKNTHTIQSIFIQDPLNDINEGQSYYSELDFFASSIQLLSSSVTLNNNIFWVHEPNP